MVLEDDGDDDDDDDDGRGDDDDRDDTLDLGFVKLTFGLYKLEDRICFSTKCLSTWSNDNFCFMLAPWNQ